MNSRDKIPRDLDHVNGNFFVRNTSSRSKIRDDIYWTLKHNITDQYNDIVYCSTEWLDDFSLWVTVYYKTPTKFDHIQEQVILKDKIMELINPANRIDVKIVFGLSCWHDVREYLTVCRMDESILIKFRNTTIENISIMDMVPLCKICEKLIGKERYENYERFEKHKEEYYEGKSNGEGKR